MTSRSSCPLLLVGLMLGLGCEVIAPLKALPDARDAAFGDAGFDSGDVAEANREDGGIPDGGAEAGRPVSCDPSLAFGDAIPVYGLNRDLGTEQRVSLSADELTAYLTIGRSEIATDIYTAIRGSTMQPFGSPTPILSLNSVGSELGVSSTGDGLALFFDSHRSDARKIYVATRSTINDPFGSPRELALYAGQANQLDPYVLPDGSALYFTSDAPQYGIYRAKLSTTGAAPPTPVILGSSRFPVVSQDELTLYFAGNFDEDLEIQMATRHSPDVPFGRPTSLTNLNTPDADDAPRWISPDGCRLYLTRTFSGDVSISLVAERIRN